MMARLLLAWLCVAPAASAAAIQSAHAPAPPSRLSFDIPAQSLDTALALYFRLTGVPLLYDSAVTANRRSSPVRGTFSPREALRRMLTGSGLVARYTRSEAVVIAPAESGAESGGEAGAPIPLGRVVVRERVAPPRVSALDRLSYYSPLAQAIRARLGEDRRTARLAFHALLALQIREDGVAEQVTVERSSGNEATDRLLAVVLTGAALPPPPAALGQPLRIAVQGRRPGDQP
jgi:hypothetical protein